MDNSFFRYLEQLELMAFFSGYPLLFVVINFLASVQQTNKLFNQKKITSLLPVTYALVGLLFIGLQLKKTWPHFSFNHFISNYQSPLLFIWGFLAILFFIPALSKKPLLSFFHSLVFFYFLLKDMFLFLFQSANSYLLKNDMSIYTKSILLNSAAFIFILLIYLLVTKLKTKKKNQHL